MTMPAIWSKTVSRWIVIAIALGIVTAGGAASRANAQGWMDGNFQCNNLGCRGQGQWVEPRTGNLIEMQAFIRRPENIGRVTFTIRNFRTGRSIRHEMIYWKGRLYSRSFPGFTGMW